MGIEFENIRDKFITILCSCECTCVHLDDIYISYVYLVCFIVNTGEIFFLDF